MQSNAARIGVLVAVVAAAVVLFVVLSGGDDDEGDNGTATTAITAAPTETQTTTVPIPPEAINVHDGKPVGGVRTLTYEKGEQVRLLVSADSSVEEVHVHGYEITEPTSKDAQIRVTFTADIDGLFEIEAHLTNGSEAQIAELRVNP
jgi:hypothetical protein